MASSGNSEQFLKLIQNRRTYYELSSESTISTSQVEEIVQQSLAHVPSSFNSQSTRVIVLFKSEHEKLWDIVTEVLKAKVPEAKWAPTGRKMAMFKQSLGTVSDLCCRGTMLQCMRILTNNLDHVLRRSICCQELRGEVPIVC